VARDTTHTARSHAAHSQNPTSGPGGGPRYNVQLPVQQQHRPKTKKGHFLIPCALGWADLRLVVGDFVEPPDEGQDGGTLRGADGSTDTVDSGFRED
jgi:hypothetical protein